MAERPATPRAAMVVIGDEILSGRIRDANMYHLARELADRGIVLAEVRVVPDDHDAIVAAIRALAPGHDAVFTSGGIGPTHDDVTAEAVAEAMGAAISVRDDARRVLAAHYDKVGVDLNAARLRMARVPEGATLIDNPISAAPGFTIGNVHVMAGVPDIFAAMLAALLPTLTGGAPILSRTLTVLRAEGDIAGPLGALAEANRDLSFGSYPFQRDGAYGATVVIRGTDAARIEAAATSLAGDFPGDLL